MSVYANYAKGDTIAAMDIKSGKECFISFRDFETIARRSNASFCDNIMPDKLFWNNNGSCTFKQNFEKLGNVAMPGFAAFFVGNAKGALKLGIKRKSLIALEKLDKYKNFTIQTNDYSHTERQLINRLVADNNINTETKGTICVFTRSHACVDEAQSKNGNICCVDYYERLAQIYPNIDFHIYFFVGDAPRNIAFQIKYFQDKRIKTIRMISAIARLISAGTQIDGLRITDNQLFPVGNNGNNNTALANRVLGVWNINNLARYNGKTSLQYLVNSINAFLTKSATESQISDFFNYVWKQNHIKYHAIK